MKKFKNFNYTRKKNPNKKYVDNIKKPWWKLNKEGKKSFELDRNTIYEVLKIFLDDCNVPNKEKVIDKKLTEYSIKPDYLITPKENTKKKFTAWDKINKKEIPIKGIVFEYDGDKHYYSTFKIESDRIKMKELAKIGYRRIRVPFYYQLTKDLAKFLFDDLMYHFTGKKYYSLEKYEKAIFEVYRHPMTGEKLNNEDLNNDSCPIVYSPGMSLTEYVPSTFHEEALKKFLDDFEFKSPRPGAEKICFPESAKKQIFRSLQLYIKDTKNEDGEREHLILPDHNSLYAKKIRDEYNKFINNPNKEYFKEVFYIREEYQNLLD